MSRALVIRTAQRNDTMLVLYCQRYCWQAAKVTAGVLTRSLLMNCQGKLMQQGTSATKSAQPCRRDCYGAGIVGRKESVAELEGSDSRLCYLTVLSALPKRPASPLLAASLHTTQREASRRETRDIRRFRSRSRLHLGHQLYSQSDV